MTIRKNPFDFEKNVYASRAALKLDSVAQKLDLHFKGKVVLDVGSSSGGFSDYALKKGAAKVIAVDKGTDQMNPKVRLDSRLELHEKTDIREFKPLVRLDILLIDVSFVSLRDILPSLLRNAITKNTQVIAMAKPQFETKDDKLKNHGVIKNERMRRELLSGLEAWLKQYFVIIDKADSKVSGSKGNRERFYKLKPIA
ncbi:TlyA family RNA methyltransferase [Patescibacteria group bacterium]|nr:TlyA family RNA methyltransferase [Patescibacteria group bacterium]